MMRITTLGFVLAAALMLAPFVLPSVGIGGNIQNSVFQICSSGPGTGLAGLSSGLLGMVPVLGDSLATGGLWNAGLAVGAIVGGHLWHHLSGSRLAMRAGMVLGFALLLPGLMAGLSMGINFLTMLTAETFTGNMASFNHTAHMLTALTGNIGYVGMPDYQGTVMAMFAHLYTCGGAALVASFMGRRMEHHHG
jgi:hypothetical protein